ncbi:hypothetical protein [Peribacillus frigoritolerans]|uniref:hypothetical protein n=1 Tax=Peribacillus frigoritolerans TaxID=450367 RepID=UPI003800B0F4
MSILRAIHLLFYGIQGWRDAIMNRSNLYRHGVSKVRMRKASMYPAIHFQLSNYREKNPGI